MRSPCLGCNHKAAPQCRYYCSVLKEYDDYRINKSNIIKSDTTYTQAAYLRELRKQKYIARFGKK